MNGLLATQYFARARKRRGRGSYLRARVFLIKMADEEVDMQGEGIRYVRTPQQSTSAFLAASSPEEPLINRSSFWGPVMLMLYVILLLQA